MVPSLKNQLKSEDERFAKSEKARLLVPIHTEAPRVLVPLMPWSSCGWFEETTGNTDHDAVSSYRGSGMGSDVGNPIRSITLLQSTSRCNVMKCTIHSTVHNADSVRELMYIGIILRTYARTFTKIRRLKCCFLLR